MKNTVHGMLGNEAYMGTLVWGKRSKGKAPPVRVEGAVPAIVSAEEFGRVQELLRSRAPKVEHPRRVSGAVQRSRRDSCGQRTGTPGPVGRECSRSESERSRYWPSQVPLAPAAKRTSN